MLQTTVKSLQKECTKLADEKRELIIRSEELQSQLNEAILRSSQSKKMKQELTHKLDDTQSHLAQQKQIYD
jgi:regulator of replication initiation timing